MSGMLPVLVAVALGAIGSLVRAEVTWWSLRRTGSARAGTWSVNLLGAFVLGAVVSLAADGRLDETVARVVGLGLLGGLTTFSTWMVVVLRPAGPGATAGRSHPRARPRDVLVHGAGMLVAGVAAAAAGAALAGLGG